MKILMLTPYLPYPDSSGGQIRTQNLLKHLKKDHHITLFSLIKNDSERKFARYLVKDFCDEVRVFKRPEKPWTIGNIFKTGFSTLPFLVVRNFSPEAKSAIDEELKVNHYDVIHIETFYAMPHLPNTDIPVVLVDQTIEYQVYDHFVRHNANPLIRPILAVDVAKLKYWERFYWRKAQNVIAVSETDKKEMLRLEPTLRVDIVPNGVNLEFFKQKLNWDNKPPIVLFVGNFHWLQNTEAALTLIEKIFPIIKIAIPDAQLHIVGQHHPRELIERSSKDVIITKLAENDQAGIRQAYYQSNIFVAPIKGPGGTRLKILAAMASQLPIVSTTVGFSGLGVIDGKHVIVRNTIKEIADESIKILKSPKVAQKLATDARKFVQNNYDYKVISAKLSSIYQSMNTK